MLIASLALLLGLALTAFSATEKCECKHYPGGAAPGGPMVISIVEMDESFTIDSVAIKGLFVDHAMPSALKISLSAVPPDGNMQSVVLKDVPSEGTGQDIRDVTFADEAGAPISSLTREGQAISPKEGLAVLAQGSSTQAGEGGSRGKWVLRIKDLSLEAKNPIVLAGWELVLCAVGKKMYLPSTHANMGQSQRELPEASAQGNAPPEGEVLETLVGESVGSEKDGAADAASPVPQAGATEKRSDSTEAGFSPSVLEAFLQRLQRVGSEEEASNTSEPILDRLMARLNDLIPSEEEGGVFSLSLANGTQLSLPTDPTVSLLESLQDLVSDTSSNAASVVPSDGASDMRSDNTDAGFSPRVVETFLQRVQRVGFEEEASNTSEPILDRLMARLNDLIPSEEDSSGLLGEGGVYSLSLANGTQLSLPTGPTVSLLESLQDLVSNTSSSSLPEGIMQQSSSGFRSSSLLDQLDFLDGEGFFGDARDQAKKWYKEQLQEANKVVDQANRALKQRAQDGGPLTDAALRPYETGLRWLKAGISQLELMAENDLRSLGQATQTGATPSAFRINLQLPDVSSLLDNIRIFDGLFGDQKG